MSFGVDPVWLDTITADLEAQLAKKTGLPNDCVFTSVLRDEDHLLFPPADRFCVVTPTNFPADAGTFDGGGRALAGFNGRIRVAAVCRFNADQDLRSGRLLRDKTRGLMALAQRVLDAVWGWAPLSADGSCYLREPARCESLDFLPKSSKDGPWAVAATLWGVKFTAALPSGNS